MVGNVVCWRKKKKKNSLGRAETDMFLLAWSCLVLVLTIAVVEYIIRANGIEGLGDVVLVGQLVPLLAGCLGLWFGLQDIVPAWGRSRCWTLFGYHFT